MSERARLEAAEESQKEADVRASTVVPDAVFSDLCRVWTAIRLPWPVQPLMSRSVRQSRLPPATGRMR